MNKGSLLNQIIMLKMEIPIHHDDYISGAHDMKQ